MDAEGIDPADDDLNGGDPLDDALDAALDTGAVSIGQPISHHSFASGAASLTISQAFQFIFRSVIAVVLAHYMTPSDFGLLGLVAVVTGLLERTISDSGLVNALVHRDGVSEPLNSSVFFFNVATGIAIAGSIMVAAPVLASLVGTSNATPVFRGVAVTFAIAGMLHVPQAILRRAFRYTGLAILGAVNALVTGIVAIPLAVAGHGVASLVIGGIVGIIAEVIAGFVLTRWRPLVHFRLSEVRSLSSYSSNYAAFHFVNYFSDVGDKFVVGRFVGQAALGYYAVPYRLVFAPILAAAQVFRDLFFSVFVRKQHDPSAIGRDYIRAVTALAALTFPFSAIIAALGTPIVAVVLGRQWLPAGPIVSVMSIVVLIQSVLVTTGLLLTATGRTNILLRWGVGSAIVMFTCYSAGAFWGAMGVACGFLLGTVLLTYPAIAIPFKYLESSVWTLFRALIPVAFATLLATMVAVAIRVALESRGASSLVIVAIGVTTASLVYLGVLLLERPPLIGDVRLLIASRFRRPAPVPVGNEELR